MFKARSVLLENNIINDLKKYKSKKGLPRSEKTFGIVRIAGAPLFTFLYQHRQVGEPQNEQTAAQTRTIMLVARQEP